MIEQWNPGIVYLRITPKKGEPAFVSENTCWNKDMFVESQRAARAKEGGSIEVITEQQYKELR